MHDPRSNEIYLYSEGTNFNLEHVLRQVREPVEVNAPAEFSNKPKPPASKSLPYRNP